MYAEGSSISCGVREINGLRSPKRYLVRDFKQAALGRVRWDGYKAAHLLFSDVARNSPGYELAKELRRIYPGSIRMSPVARNDNSSNDIRVWIFTPPEEFWNTPKRRARR